MVSNLSLSEKLQSRLSRSFHASRALRFVPKSLRFLFWNFRKRSSCFLLVRLPSISRKSLDYRSLDFYAMKFSWFASLSGFLRPLLASFFILSHFRLFVKNFFPFFSAPLAAPAASLRQLVYITRSPPPCQSLFLLEFPQNYPYEINLLRFVIHNF